MKIKRLKKVRTALVLPDMHAPFINWKAVEKAHKWAEKHSPDVVIQLGDIIDAKAWSRWPKDPDDYSPTEEFELTVDAIERLAEMFPKMHIISGNHDRRFQIRALDASLPKRMVRELDELFDVEGWNWYMDPKEKLVLPSARGDILFLHGDEMGGTPINKAVTLGYNVVQGHTHKASIQYIQAMDKFYFGAEMGHLMDVNSKGARYAAANPRGTCCGFGIIKHGIPWWIPSDGARV